jgi:hypothetical protein
MRNDNKGISGISAEARTALNVLAIRSIALAQRANLGSFPISHCEVCDALEEVAESVKLARQEIGGAVIE